jgi:O-antigen/teichoic acid export membrane protein
MIEASAPGRHAAPIRVVKNSIWLIAQPLLMNAISLFAIAYIARGLGKDDYGRFVYALSFITMFTPLTNLGLRMLTVRDIAVTRERADLPDFIGRMLVLRFSLALFGAALAIGVVSFLQQSPDTRHVVYLATCILLLQGLTTTVTDVFQAFETMRHVAHVQFVSGLLLTVLSVVAIFLGYGLIGLMASYVIGNFVGAALSLYYLRANYTAPRLSIDLRFWKESLVKAAPFFFPTLISQTGRQLGVVLLGSTAGASAVGTYGAASTLMDKLNIIPDGVCTALFPTLAATFKTSQEEAAALYRRFFGYFLIIAIPIAVGTAILSRPLILLLYGARYQGTPIVLTILVWALFLSFFTQLQSWTSGAIHQERKVFFVPIASTVCYLIAVAALVPRHAELGLAICTLVPWAVMFVLFGTIIRRHLVRQQVDPRLLAKVLVAALVMAAATYAVRKTPIFVSIPVGAVTYAAMVLALRIVSPKELTALRAMVRGRGKARPSADGPSSSDDPQSAAS